MSLFPPLEPYATHMLPVGDGHRLYVEESGNPHGLPALVLHGGPGSGCTPDHRRRFDPTVWRIVCLDQRGCGRSVAPAEGPLHANTTQHLIADNETIRQALGIETWACVYGTSWGSTLALVYAQAHPDKLKSLILGGIWLADNESFEWWVNPMGLPQMLPTEFAAVQAFAPHMQGHALMVEVAKQGGAAAVALAFYEGMAMELEPDAALISAYVSNPEKAAGRQINTAYYAAKCYLTEDQILSNAHKIAHLPITLLHGRQDMVCPPKGAHRLAEALQASGGKPTLRLIGACGHRSTPAMEAARVEAIAEMAKRVG